MRRCFDLAIKGEGSVSPNPLVGSVIVSNNEIIGEGYHEKYGGHHAEVNAIRNIKQDKLDLLDNSTIYVNLEPCSHFGKTPPCADLIIEKRIPEVVISNLDPFPHVDGTGIKKLIDHGIAVRSGILEQEGAWLNRFFMTSVQKKRPYVILKVAKDSQGFIGRKGEAVWITSVHSKRLAHKWRNEVDAIMIGTRTAQVDDPHLSNRLWSGKSPVRVVLDKLGVLSPNLNVFKGEAKSVLVTEALDAVSKFKSPPEILHLDFDENLNRSILSSLWNDWKISSLLVEGGAFTIQKFIDNNIWDEARIIESDTVINGNIHAPAIEGTLVNQFLSGQDMVSILANPSSA